MKMYIEWDKKMGIKQWKTKKILIKELYKNK